MTAAAGRRAGAIPRSHLSDEVYRQLWERILDRRLQPGEKLSDLRLSAELGVSRTPVREALHRLVNDGILRAEPHRGFFVESFSPRDVTEIYDLRAALEAMALERAAPRLTDTALRRALADLDGVERRLRGAAGEPEHLAAARAFLEVDRGFHRLIVEAADNGRLTAIMEGLWAQIAVFQHAGSFRDSWTELAIRQHRGVIAALLEGDVPAAVQRLTEHIVDVKGLVLRDWAVDAARAAEETAA